MTAKIPSKGMDNLKSGGTTYGKDIKASGKAKSKEVWVKITRQEYEGRRPLTFLADQQMRAVCAPPSPKPRLAS